MSERYPLLPELVLCIIGLYLGLIGIFHRSGLPTQSEMIAARIEERTRQRAEATRDVPRQTADPVDPLPRQEDGRLPPALGGFGHIPPEFLPEALRGTGAIPTLRVEIVDGKLQFEHAGTMHTAAGVLAHLRRSGISEARIHLSPTLLQDERLAMLVTDAMREGIQFHVELEAGE